MIEVLEYSPMWRENFETLLLAEGIPFEAISSYMGHVDINRTWNSYRDRERAIFPEEFKAAKIITISKKKNDGVA